MTDTPHPSGLPAAPWRLGPFGIRYVYGTPEGEQIVIVQRLTEEECARISAAIAILPDLIVEAQRLIAADRAFEESAPDSADEKAALNQWNEISIDAVGKLEALLTRAGIPTPSLPEPPASLPPDPDEAILAVNPGGSA